MKKMLLTLCASVLASTPLLAQSEVLRIAHGNTTDYALLADIDSLYFSEDGTQLLIQPQGEFAAVSIARADISSMGYTTQDECPGKLKIKYNQGEVLVENPFFLCGVTVSTDGAYVTVNNTNTTTEYTTKLSGTTTDGALEYNGTYKTTIELDGVSITSRKGAALNILCGKRVNLEVKKETENTLVDAAAGDQKAALYCKGHLEIDKAGTLNVTGNTAHAIAAKEYLKLKKSEGIINVLGAVKDGIHCKQYFVGNGFTVNISNVGDDCIQTELDTDDEATATTLFDEIVNGTLIINGGNYTLVNNVNGSVEGTDTHTAKGLNADGNMQLVGGDIQITMTGTGGKGIRVEGTYTQGAEDGTGPNLRVATTGSAFSGVPAPSYGGGGGGGGNRPGGGGTGGSTGADAKAIKVLGAVQVLGGTSIVTTAANGAEGLESKTSIDIAGGTHYFRTYDDAINSSGPITFSGGNTVCYATGNDAVDSNYGRTGAISIAGGNVFAYSAAGGAEEGFDCDNNSYITITGGIGISAGGAQGGSSSASVGSSTQGYYLGSSPSSYATGNYYTLYSTTGEAICTYRFEKAVSNTLSLLTAPDLGKGSISVKYGTSAPESCTTVVNSDSGDGMFFIAPTVTATTTAATLTSK